MPEFSPDSPLAYENSEFLNSPDGRVLRILAEYQEPMSRFRRERIQDTVVFFGSARFRALDVANSELELLANTGSTQLAPEEEQPATMEEIQRGEATRLQLKRAEAAVEMARYYEDARTLAGMMASWAKTLPRTQAPVCGDLRRRPRNYGGGQPRRIRSGREDDWA